MKSIARSEKENFSSLMAAVFAPPDQALLADLAQAQLLFPRVGGITLELLQEEYDRLFANWGGESISLIESTYKTWTLDRDCGLPFAGKKGAIMGDYALHLESIFRALSSRSLPFFMAPRIIWSLSWHFFLTFIGRALKTRFKISSRTTWIGSRSLRGKFRKPLPIPFIYRRSNG